MKQRYTIILLAILGTVLTGCPYDSPYNIDPEPMVAIDEALLGKWGALVEKPGDDQHFREDTVQIIFEKRTDMEYDIAITGYIDELKPYHIIVNDTIKGTAYLSDVAGKQFLNTFIHGKVYIAEVKKNKSGVSILPLAEAFTSKLIKNSKELRTAIEFHCKIRLVPGYDQQFCLKNLQKEN